MVVFGGVLGWVLGVLLRAGPMFVVDWRMPPALARALPFLLALAVLLTALSATAPVGAATSIVFARLGDLTAVGTALAAVVAGGAVRRAPRALPMLSRSPAETRLFRLALACLAAAAIVAAVSVPLADSPLARLLGDAIRHLVTIGFLTSVVVAMTFRLIPILETAPLRWPRLRTVAFWALLAAVTLRTAQIAVGLGGRPLAHAVALSGVFAWLAVAAVGLALGAAIAGSPPAGKPSTRA
jgi:hypothetical protein